MTASDSRVLQVTNISPSVTMEQLEMLFSFLGPIDEMQVFPKTNTIPVSSKVAFIRFQSKSAVETGQHLSNTVFIDKAIICVCYVDDETVAMQYVAPAVESEGDEHQIPGNVDPTKVEEIKRTIYVGNLDSKTATAEQLLQFFSTCGEVRFVRMAGDETQPTRFAFVEFADTAAVQNAIQLNGMLFGDRPIKVNHSNNAIVKPQNKTQETTAKEIEEAMRRVREAQSLISKALEPEIKERRRRSKSRSRSRHRRRRSRSGSRKRRSGSRSRRKRRSRSRSPNRSRSRRSRSRSSKRRHRRSRSRSPKRSRSKKRERSSSRKKEISKSRSPSKKSSRHKKDRKRERERDRDRDKDGKKRRRRSRSRSSSKEGDKDGKGKNEKKDKDTEKKEERKEELTKEITITEKKTQDEISETPTAVVANGDENKENGD